MHILDGGRTAYLEFLRNLSSQAIILAVAFVVIAKNNLQPLTCCYIENTKETFVAISCFILWFFAYLGNLTLFMEKYLISQTKTHKVLRICKHRKYNIKKRLLLTMKYSLRKEKFMFWELTVFIVICIISMAIVFWLAINSSASYLKLLHSSI
jgi:hypothetical protein